MDVEFEKRVKFEYQLEQLTNAFQNRYEEERKYTIELSVNTTNNGRNKILNFDLNNDITVIGIQFDLYVPDNIETVEFNTTNRSENFIITDTNVAGVMRRVTMTCENLDGIIYEDNDEKTVLTATLIPYEGYSVGGGTVSIRSINITAAEPNIYNKEDMTIKL